MKARIIREPRCALLWRIDESYPNYAAIARAARRYDVKLRPVADGDIFTACLSSYRASGTGGYDCYVGCPVLREIGTEMSDLLLDFFKAHDQKLPITHCEFRVI